MNKEIQKKDIKSLIEPHFYQYLKSDTYEIISIKADELLIWSRFDFAFKLLYLDLIEKNPKFAKKVYREHIRAFSLGKFIEPGNEEKNNIKKFEDDFLKTFNNIKERGFDKSKTLIPLSTTGSPLDGAHRICSAIYTNQDVDCINIEKETDIYDYQFFYKRNVSLEILDAVATKYTEYADNLYIAFIWPRAQDKKIEHIIPNIVYQKEIQLNYNGAHNLLSQIYFGEKWLGNIENNFSGTSSKLIECFPTFSPFKVIAFQASSFNDVLKIKEDVRKLINVGKHSIHITDTKEEAIRTARLVFNDNSIHFLNYAKPNKYISTHKKIETFKEFIKKNNIDFNDVVLDGGIILSVYGLRESSGIDYFTVDNSKLEYHDEDKIEMIFNPKYHFYFNDIKFISFKQLYKMKTNRAEEKDKNDCKMMEALIEDNKFKEFINRLKQNIYYGKIKFKANFYKFLKKIKLYSFIKMIYRFIKGVK